MPKEEFHCFWYSQWMKWCIKDNLTCREDEKVTFSFAIEHLAFFYFILHSYLLRKKKPTSAYGKEYNPVIKGLHLRRCWKEYKPENNLEVLAFFGILFLLRTSSKSLFRTDLHTVTAELVGDCTSQGTAGGWRNKWTGFTRHQSPYRPLWEGAAQQCAHRIIHTLQLLLLPEAFMAWLEMPKSVKAP